MCFKLLCEEQNNRKVAASLYIFLITSNEEEKYAKMMQSNSSDNYLYHYRGHSKSTFDEEGKGDHWKANNKEQGEIFYVKNIYLQPPVVCWISM